MRLVVVGFAGRANLLVRVLPRRCGTLYGECWHSVKSNQKDNPSFPYSKDFAPLSDTVNRSAAEIAYSLRAARNHVRYPCTTTLQAKIWQPKCNPVSRVFRESNDAPVKFIFG